MYFMLDNFDSYVYNLYAYFQELGQEIVVKRADEVTIEEIIDMNPEGIIISPGPGRPIEATLSLLIIEYFKGKVPILGVCLGHQVRGQYFGAEVKKGKAPMHGKISSVFNDGKNLFEEMPRNINVTRYHSLAVYLDENDKELDINAVAKDGAIMAISHRRYPIFGVQFHPEAVLTEYGYQILKNFIRICNDWRIRKCA